MKKMRATFVTVLAIALSTVECTSSGTRATPTGTSDTPAASITPDQVNSLAGKWKGWWIGTSGSAAPLEVEVNPNGTYVSRIGDASGAGEFRIVDGKIVTSGHLSGPSAPVSDRTSVVTLVDKGGRPTLMGQGRTERGPYSFELTKE